MTQENPDLWQEEQLAFIRKAREETSRFVAEHRVLSAEAQERARIMQQALGLDSSSRYGLPVLAAAFLSVTIAAMAGSAMGLALCRVVAAQCAGTIPV